MQEAVKHDTGKPDWSIMPWDSVEEVQRVLDFGAKKYAAWNWTEGGGFKWRRVFSSLMRHVLAWVRGEDNDPESGISHLAHAGCNVLFLLYYVKHREKFGANDDRFVINPVIYD